MIDTDRLTSFAESIKGALVNVMVNGGDELAMAKATIEHMSGCLGAEIEENEHLRSQIAELREEVELWKDRCAAERRDHEATIEEIDRDREW